jgi:Na+/phosphate symporter
MLITIGTNYKLPLSTTYVTFMVAMGTSLADRAWSRESAVFRVTGVLSVIGGWFITAGVAFLACAMVALLMYYGGIIVQTAFMALVIYLLIRSSRQYKKKQAENEEEQDSFRLMMRTRDPELVWDLLKKHVSNTQARINRYALEQYNTIIDGFKNQKVRDLRKSDKALKAELEVLKKSRRQEMLALKKSPTEIAVERNTWFHIGANSDQQFIYTLRRLLTPIKEHVDNNFNPFPKDYAEEFEPIRQKINDLMLLTCEQIETGRYENYRDVLSDADACKDELSVIRQRHINRMQQAHDNKNLQVAMVYLNVLQESQQFLSVMRHQLRAAKRFTED